MKTTGSGDLPFAPATAPALRSRGISRGIRRRPLQRRHRRLALRALQWPSSGDLSGDRSGTPHPSSGDPSTGAPALLPATLAVTAPTAEMARLGISLRRKRQFEFLRFMCIAINCIVMMYMVWYLMSKTLRRSRELERSRRSKREMRMHNLHRITRGSDTVCRNYLRINRRTFSVLCEMVRDIGGLTGTRNMCIEEILTSFLYTLAHHKKNRTIGGHFYRSGETVSRQFHACLRAILKLHVVLLKRPSPITEDCNDDRWKLFKNCLGALDGTMISVNAPAEERSKYRTRKGITAMNVLGVCSPDMEFIYVLPGWEGLAHDGRVLRDAISRPNGLKVPRGCYYLCDAGYTNGEGFLAPYRGHIYHLREWNNSTRQPQSAEEYFNLRHASARNVIERCFGLLKGRWAILRSPTWFSLQTRSRIVLACALLHNLVKRYMSDVSLDEALFEGDNTEIDEIDEDDSDEVDDENGVEFIGSIETSDPWNNFRNDLAQSLFNAWRARGRRE